MINKRKNLKHFMHAQVHLESTLENHKKKLYAIAEADTRMALNLIKSSVEEELTRIRTGDKNELR